MTLSQPVFAHANGYQQLLYNLDAPNDDSRILSVGCDGDGRIWCENSLELDDEPIDLRLGASVECASLRGDLLIVGLTTNDKRHVVKKFNYPLCDQSDILIRFTLQVSAVTISKDKGHIAAGSADFEIKYALLNDPTDVRRFVGHVGPILCLTFSNQNEYLASSSSDGDVCVWQLSSDLNDPVKRLKKIHKNKSDKNENYSLIQIAFHPITDDLIIPHEHEVKIYQYASWNPIRIISHPTMKDENEILSLIALSHDCKYISIASVSGRVHTFNYDTGDFISTIRTLNGKALSSIIFQPGVTNTDDTTLILLDWTGDLTAAVGVLQVETLTNRQSSPPFNEPVVTESKNRPRLFEDDDETSQNSIDLLQLKKQYGFNNEGEQVAFLKPGGDDDAALTTIDYDDEIAVQADVKRPFHHAYMPMAPQKPFVPTAAPEHLSTRFMKYNQFGIIRQYNTDNETSIEIEYHDVSVMSQQTLANHEFNYTIADLNMHAYALASRGDYDRKSGQSLVTVHLLNADANSREWTSLMPVDEVIECIVIGGRSFVAVATSRQIVRIYSIAGVQLQLISLPGMFVTMCAHDTYLCVVYHTGSNVDYEREITMHHLKAEVHDIDPRSSNLRKSQILSLPLTPNSTLAWLGYSRQGNLCAYNSDGILNRYNGRYWTPIFDARHNLKNKTDTLWIYAVDELPTSLVRAVLVRGQLYPNTLPTPIPIAYNWRLPVADEDKPKAEFEQNLLLANERLATDNGADNEITASLRREELTALIKLFSAAADMDRELRCLDIADLMPNADAVEHLINFASKLNKLTLAQKLGAVARRKFDEARKRSDERKCISEVDEPTISSSNVESTEKDQIVYKPSMTGLKRKAPPKTQNDVIPPCVMEEMQSSTTQSQRVSIDTSFGDLNSTTSPTTPCRPNPFRRIMTPSDSPLDATGRTSIFECLNVSKRQRVDKENKTTPMLKKGRQTTLSFGKENACTVTHTQNTNVSSQKETPYQKWLRLNEQHLKARFDGKDAEYNKWAMQQFRMLTTEEKQQWAN